MPADTSYIKNYSAKRVYVNPAPGKGAYASLADDTCEEVLGEFDLNNRSRVAVSMFLSKENAEPKTIELHLLKFRKNSGWYHEESIRFNGFEAAKLDELLTIMASVKLDPTKTQRFDLGAISPDQFFSFHDKSDLARRLSEDVRLEHDVFAIARKRTVLNEFKALLEDDTSETVWQEFLEKNPWIFGFGLNYVFLDRVSDKFEATTTGSDVFTPGKRADGLAMTKAQVSQTVLIEIKASKSPLLQAKPYRKGVWPVDNEVAAAVSQSQKTSFEFARRNAVKLELTDDLGDETGNALYTVEPRAYLIVGNLSQLTANNDKIASFELFRRKLTSPEILTFDELYYRAVALVDSISSSGR